MPHEARAHLRSGLRVDVLALVTFYEQDQPRGSNGRLSRCYRARHGAQEDPEGENKESYKSFYKQVRR